VVERQKARVVLVLLLDDAAMKGLGGQLDAGEKEPEARTTKAAERVDG
jgi:hypothetical protein